MREESKSLYVLPLIFIERRIYSDYHKQTSHSIQWPLGHPPQSISKFMEFHAQHEHRRSTERSIAPYNISHTERFLE